MVVKRRQVVSEQDRYGGYGLQQRTMSENPQVEIDDNFNVDSAQQSFSGFSRRDISTSDSAPFSTDGFPKDTFSRKETFNNRDSFLNESVTVKPFVPDRMYSKPASRVKTLEQNKPIYSARPSVTDYVGRDTEQVALPKEKEKEKQKLRNKEDLMPSIRTEKKAKESENTAPREKATLKTKVILAVYMLAVILLATVVIGTGIAITNATSSISLLESDIAIKNSLILQQNTTLDELSDELLIAKKAEELGMEKSNNINEITLVPVINPLKYEGRTNWFDTFCDWFSGLIGGK